MYHKSDFSSKVSIVAPESCDNIEKETETSSRKGNPQITLQEFFDFLSSAFKAALDPEDKSIYKELLTNEFVTKLLEISVGKFKSNVDADGKINAELLPIDQGRPNDSKFGFLQDEEKMQGIRSLFIRLNKKPNDPDFPFSQLPILEAENILKKKLQEVIDDAILDSMFPFIISKFSSLNEKHIEENSPNVGYLHKTNKQSNKQRTRKLNNPE